VFVLFCFSFLPFFVVDFNEIEWFNVVVVADVVIIYSFCSASSSSLP
jgi:hypothetical protein